jgi:predicted GNAT family acetyltransferase
MEFCLFDNIDRFLEYCLPVLQQEEVANSLILGIAHKLRENLYYYGKKHPFMGILQEGNRLVAAALMTPPHNLVIGCAQEECSAAWPLLASALLDSGWSPPGVLGISEHARVFAEQWSHLTGSRYDLAMNERLYELRTVLLEPPATGSMRPARVADFDLVRRWQHAFVREALGDMEPLPTDERIKQRIENKDLFLWVDAKPVSMAARTRPMGKGIAVGDVYTPPDHRRKGYASALVASLSQHLLDSGFTYCTLFTDLSNPTSNAIYQRLGYRPVCDYSLYKFLQVNLTN